MENRINSDAVECIFNYAIRLRMMADASTSILHQLRSEGISLNIYNDITVPRIEGANEKKCVVQNVFLGSRQRRIRRERANQIDKNQ